MKLIGITRVRNESLVIADTLAHVGALVDEILLLDDASTDGTVEVARASSPVPLTVTAEREWAADRQAEETRHRHVLLAQARERGADWVYCFDADERVQGDLRTAIAANPDVGGLRLRLFDAYLSPGMSEPYTGGVLDDLPRLYGPEERQILMAWNVRAGFEFVGRDKREPTMPARVSVGVPEVFVKHFGKGLSEEQWEETCEYYATHFPEPYRSKWEARRGKAIHTTSDFDRPLYAWPDVIDHAHLINPRPLRLPRRIGRPERVIRRLLSGGRP